MEFRSYSVEKIYFISFYVAQYISFFKEAYVKCQGSSKWISTFAPLQDPLTQTNATLSIQQCFF